MPRQPLATTLSLTEARARLSDCVSHRAAPSFELVDQLADIPALRPELILLGGDWSTSTAAPYRSAAYRILNRIGRCTEGLGSLRNVQATSAAPLYKAISLRCLTLSGTASHADALAAFPLLAC